jgi:hypothetical protein
MNQQREAGLKKLADYVVTTIEKNNVIVNKNTYTNKMLALEIIGGILELEAKKLGTPRFIKQAIITYNFSEKFDWIDPKEFADVLYNLENYVCDLKRYADHVSFDVVAGIDESGQWWTLKGVSDDFQTVFVRTQDEKLAYELKEFFDQNLTIIE